MQVENQKQKVSKATTGNRTGKAKAVPVNRTFQQEFVLLGQDVKKSVLGFFHKWEKFRDIVKNNYELGRMHLGLSNYRDALMRFKFVLWLQPGHVDAMYYLGATYMALG